MLEQRIPERGPQDTGDVQSHLAPLLSSLCHCGPGRDLGPQVRVARGLRSPPPAVATPSWVLADIFLKTNGMRLSLQRSGQ